MLAAVVQWLIRVFPWLSYDYRRRVRRNEKCVACGSTGRKDLRYDPVEKLVVVQCPICLAAWGRDPLVKAGKWARPVTEK